MAERTKWGRWLENALRERGLKAIDLATQAKLSRSTISQLMAGNIKSVSPALREQIAFALRIATEEVPLPADFIEQFGSVSGPKFFPTPSYFAPGEEPPKTVLRFIDHGIPDHLLPRLAWTKGYFEPFNISLSVDSREQREYPEDQRRAFMSSSIESPILASGPEEAFLDPNYPQEPVKGTFVARVNKYNGYALITRSDTTLPQVTSKRPDDKVSEFVNLMDKIANRGARDSVAFVDDPAGKFYEILWDLYYDLENLPDPNEEAKQQKRGNASKELDGQDLEAATDQASSVYKLPVLDRLHEIGDLRADLAVGTADAVALAYSSAKHPFASRRYKVLVTYSDIDEIVSDLHLSPKFVKRLTERPWAETVKNPLESLRVATPSDSAERNGSKASQDFVYNRFQSKYRTRLDNIQLNNVWAVNLPLTDSDDCRALACRIAGVAFRTVELLRDPDTQQMNSNLEQLLSLLTERRVKGPDIATEPSEGYHKLTMPDFVKVWCDSYSLEPYEEYYKWLFPDPNAPPESGPKPVRDSLRKVAGWMEKEREAYEELIEELTSFESLPEAAEEHLMRAKHHYSIYSFWDAARYAAKAKAVVSELSVNSRGGTDG